MYITCMFCNKSLGEKQVVEIFPVDRHMALRRSKGTTVGALPEARALEPLAAGEVLGSGQSLLLPDSTEDLLAKHKEAAGASGPGASDNDA